MMTSAQCDAKTNANIFPIRSLHDRHISSERLPSQRGYLREHLAERLAAVHGDDSFIHDSKDIADDS